MRRSASILAAIAAVALALAPALADARPGGGSSSGSRGSRTYSAPPPTNTAPGQARSFDRTTTQPGQPGVGQPGVAQPRPPIGQPNPAGGFFSRNPMMAGLMGGLLGAGLFGLLAGHGLFGGMAGIMSILGLLLQVALIAGLVFLLVRLIRGRSAAQPAIAGGVPPGAMARQMGGGPDRPMGGGASAAAGGALARGAGRPQAEFPLDAADFEAFERLLKEVNEAWSRRDLGTLRRIATPEMADYFAQDLSDLEARGWRNETRDVRLEQGDMAEAWREGAREWATVAMRFSMVDVTRRIADGVVVEGDPDRRTESTELWTFVRPQGGQWTLSAIQQTG
ncbi:MAG: TIM44-like domain-containing protein [Acetobacteraceae bacterium]|nr:TIM44-like domain-containing protein [Acetobacteraceae bacterium]